MNANRIVTMIIRLVVQRFMRRGLNRGIGQVSRRMAGGKPAGKAATRNGQAEARVGADARKTVKRARQLTRITRRLGR